MHTRNPEADGQAQLNHYPYHAPRIWHGFSMSNWVRLAWSNRHDIDRVYMACWVTFFGMMNSIGNRIQACLFKRRAARLPLSDDPVFIIGHWRTGTTLLHTLFSLDKRYAVPNNYECFTPRHFLFTESWFRPLMQFPNQRPMDNMAMGWDTPQEDELAMCVRGLPSVYRNNAFPSQPDECLDSLTMEGIAPEKRETWKAALGEFVGYLNLKHRRPIVLKSPPHTGRIKILLEMFPNARFIHIARDPYEFIPSTLHLWKALDQTNGFQNLEEDIDRQSYVFACFRRMYESYEQHKSAIPPRNLHEIRYDELTSDPVGTMREIYGQLKLEDFNQVQPALEEFMQSRSNYKRNEHSISPSLSRAIAENCGDYIRNYGYAVPQRGSQAA